MSLPILPLEAYPSIRQGKAISSSEPSPGQRPQRYCLRPLAIVTPLVLRDADPGSGGGAPGADLDRVLDVASAVVSAQRGAALGLQDGWLKLLCSRNADSLVLSMTEFTYQLPATSKPAPPPRE